MCKLATIGNATLIAYDKKPILATDPWFCDEDSAYFGSWIGSHSIPTKYKQDILAQIIYGFPMGILIISIQLV